MSRSSIARMLVGTIVLGSAILSACGDSTSPQRVRVQIAAVPDTLDVGDSLLLTALVMQGSDTLDAPISWSTSDPAIALVETDEWLHGRNPGSTIITATSSGGTASVSIVVAHPVLVSLAGPNALPLGDSVTLTVGVIERDQQSVANPAITWSTADTLIVGLSQTGKVVARGYGTARIFARYGVRVDSHDVDIPLAPFVSGPSLVSFTYTFGHYCGLTSSGQAYCGGNNNGGQVGIGTHGFDTEPFQPVVSTARFTQIEAGQYGVCALSTSRQMYCWGWNADYEHSPIDTALRRITTPRAIETDLRFRDLAHTEHKTTCGVASTLEAYCWGHNDEYQTGRAPWATRLGGIERIDGERLLSEIDGNGMETCGADAAGVAYCWGTGGVIRHPTTSGPAATAVPFTGALHGVAVGGLTACALTAQGAAVCWGDNYHGGLGNGTSGGWSETPVFVNGGHQFTKLAGSRGTCGITTAADLYCWGSYAGFRQFNPTRPVRVFPQRKFQHVSGDWTTSRICAVTTGGETYCFIEQLPQ